MRAQRLCVSRLDPTQLDGRKATSTCTTRLPACERAQVLRSQIAAGQNDGQSDLKEIVHADPGQPCDLGEPQQEADRFGRQLHRLRQIVIINEDDVVDDPPLPFLDDLGGFAS